MPKTFDWRAVLWSGISAGVVFMILEMLLVQFFGPGSMWGPPRMIAALVMGQQVLPPPGTFDAGVVMVAMAVHFPLSIVYALIFAGVASRVGLTLTSATVIGVVFGVMIYIVNFYGFTALFQWFAEARGWIAIVSHAIYGAVLGAVYQLLTRSERRREKAVMGS